mmetsp:Transcript_10344/g.33954  ORF Transcript_10344/g.33954 Transcript_10344/m.33954 type:complete len:651 (-) Transcript_10344:41-1993(-)
MVGLAGESTFPAWLGLASVLVLLASVIGLLLLRSRGGGARKTGDSSAEGSDAAGDAAKQRVTILYGTQTGTAERMASALAQELKGRYPSAAVRVMDLEALSEAETARAELEKMEVGLFLQATYGEGDPTDTSEDFFKWLTEQAEGGEQVASGMSVAVFALGNTQYEHFCSAGKAVDRALGSCGATKLLDVSLGNDDDDIQRDFEQWCEALYPKLEQGFPLLLEGAGDAVAAAPARYEVTVHAKGGKVGLGSTKAPHDLKSPFLATVSAKRELHTERSERSCLHVELSLKGSGLAYEHGDHVGVYTENNPAEVEALAARLGYGLDDVVELRAAPDSGLPEPPFTDRRTVREALTRFAEVLAPPTAAALKTLSFYCASEAEAEALRKLGGGERAEYASRVENPALSLREVLKEYPSCAPPLGALFAGVVPRLQPRYYSISSSPKADAAGVHVTAAVVRGATATGRIHEGVCTTHLERCSVGDKMPVFLRSSAFKLPKNHATPVIMVGPGTGLAPFRGFLQERASLKASGASLGEAHFYFGCRRSDHDFIYRDELESHLASGALSTLEVAFSREGARKAYVQDKLLANAAQVWRLLGEEGGSLYVCGDAKGMAKDVHRALHTIAIQTGRLAAPKAELFVKNLADQGRYHKDVW